MCQRSQNWPRVGATVELQRKEEHRQPGRRAAGGFLLPDCVHQQGQPVGNDHLFQIAAQHLHQAGLDPLIVEPVLFVQLRQHVGAALNGAGHQLGEKAHKQGIIQKAALGGQTAAVHVDGVAHRLKDIKADAHRQQHRKAAQHRVFAEHRQRGVQVIQHKGGVFKDKQDAQIQHQRRGQHSLAVRGAFHGQACRPGNGGAGQHQQGVAGVPAHIEQVAGRQQPHSPQPVGQHKISQRHRREKGRKFQ